MAARWTCQNYQRLEEGSDWMGWGLTACWFSQGFHFLPFNQKTRGDCEWAPLRSIRSLLHVLKTRA